MRHAQSAAWDLRIEQGQIDRLVAEDLEHLPTAVRRHDTGESSPLRPWYAIMGNDIVSGGEPRLPTGQTLDRIDDHEKDARDDLQGQAQLLCVPMMDAANRKDRALVN
ncbi:MAG: hypothetical protein WDO72_02395 [Pseudomonadota bacterium]